MSNEVFNREEITLQDGTVVELRPLVVFYKRKFLAVWSSHITYFNSVVEKARKAAEAGEEFEFDENSLNDRQYDTLIQLASMALGSINEELKGDKTEKQFKEYLEKTLDDPTISKIMNVCGGIDLEATNPN